MNRSGSPADDSRESPARLAITQRGSLRRRDALSALSETLAARPWLRS